MASNSTLPPPPGVQDDSSQDPQGPSTPATPSPAPPEQDSSSGITATMISVVRGLRTIASAVPLAVPGITEINQIISAKVMPAIMQSQKTGEPAAPPFGG